MLESWEIPQNAKKCVFVTQMSFKIVWVITDIATLQDGWIGLQPVCMFLIL